MDGSSIDAIFRACWRRDSGDSRCSKRSGQSVHPAFSVRKMCCISTTLPQWRRSIFSQATLLGTYPQSVDDSKHSRQRLQQMSYTVSENRPLDCKGGFWPRGPFRPNRSKKTRRYPFFQLEDRLLYSAAPIDIDSLEPDTYHFDGSYLINLDPTATVAGSFHELASVSYLDDGFVNDFHEGLQNLLELTDESIANSPGATVADSIHQLGIAHSEHANKAELLIVDQSVEYFDRLVDQFLLSKSGTRFDILYLDHSVDGVDAIRHYLDTSIEYSGLHVISHGGDGLLQLGSTTLSLESLSDHVQTISSWKSGLSSDADILFYGCRVAQSEAGKELLNQIASLTHCDVAASDDLTGHQVLGGDWTLEYSTGHIETLAFAHADQSGWIGTLEVVNFQEGANGYSSTVDTYLHQDTPSTNHGNEAVIVASNNKHQTLIRFDSVFGNSANQLDLGSDINAATLTLTINSAVPGSTVTIYQLTAAWNESSTWNSLTNGIQIGSESIATIEDSESGAGSNISFDVSASLQNWSNGASNFGWVIVTDSGTILQLHSSEAANASFRPRLNIDFDRPESFQGIITATNDEVSSGGTPGISSWTEGTALVFSDPNFQLGSNTDGEFSALVDFAAFADDGNAFIQALHYVTADLTIGNTNTFALKAGDVLFSVKDNETFNYGAGLSLHLKKCDVGVFRPDLPGDYSSGSFFKLLDQPNGNGSEIRSISLVEYTTTVGDVTLQQGDFLFSVSGGDDSEIRWFQTNNVGASTTSGSVVTLIDGDDIGFSGKAVQGVELIERTTSIGGVTFSAGDIWIAIDGAETIAGSLSVKEFDIFSITTSQTNAGSGSTIATASMVFQGSDVNIDNGDEKIQAVALLPVFNSAPSATNVTQTLNYIEGDSLVQIADIVVTDPDAGDTITATLTLSNTATGSLSASSGNGETYNSLTGVWAVSGSQAQVNAALAAVAFVPQATNDVNSSINVQIQDQAGNTVNGSIGLQVTATSAPPTVTGLARDLLNFIVGSGPQVLDQDQNANVTDVDSADFNGGQLIVQISVGKVTGEDQLGIRSQGAGAGSIIIQGNQVFYQNTSTQIGTAFGGTGNNNLVITFNANATPAAVSALMRNITYYNTQTQNPSRTPRTIEFTLSDGDGGSSSLQAASVNIVDPVVNAQTPIVIDGFLESDWSKAVMKAIGKVSEGSPTATASFGTMFDSQNLYFTVRVTDSVFVLDSGSNFSNDDSIEIFIDADLSHSFTYDSNDFHLIFRFNDYSLTASSVQLGANSAALNLANISYKMSTISGGYRLEAAVQWSDLGIVRSAGDLIGFDVHVNDDDNGGARDGRLEFADGTNQASSNPSKFGFMLLVPGVNNGPTANPYTATIDENSAIVSDSSWHLSKLEWAHRRQLTFDNSGISSNLTEFQVRVILNDSRIDYGETQDNGEDLRFVDADGTELAYEIESWNKGGTSTVWVKVPQINATGTDFIWMYYGNQNAVDSQNSAAVWSNDYSGVYHFGNPVSGAGTILDSSSGNHDGSNIGTTPFWSGLSNAQYFNSSENDAINIGSNRDFINGVSGWTLSAWINPTAATINDPLLGSNQHTFVAVSVNDSGPTSVSRASLGNNGSRIQIITRLGDGSFSETYSSSIGTLSTGWQWVVATVDYDGKGYAIYLNGSLVASGSAFFLNNQSSSTTNSTSAAIGSQDDLSGDFFGGGMDEVRIESINRDQNWIASQYRSMNGSLISFGSEQSPAGVLPSQTDGDGDSLMVSIVSGPSNAQSFALSSSGAFLYTPTANFFGTDQFTYQVSDGNGGFSQATATITVNSTNTVPVAVNDNFSGFEDQPITGNVLANDFDSDLDDIGVTLVSGPSNASSFTLLPKGNFTYVGSPNFFGTDSFTYIVTDGEGASSIATVTINVQSVNDSPVLNNSGPGSVAFVEDAGPVFVGQSISISDVDDAFLQSMVAVISGGYLASEDELLFTNTSTLTGVWNPTTGQLTITGNGTIAEYQAALQSIRYINHSNTPNASNRTISFSVNDGSASFSASNIIARTITVSPSNDAPVAVQDSFTLFEDTTFSFTPAMLLANDFDVDGNPIQFVSINQPTNGTITVSGTGLAPVGSIGLSTLLVYTPNLNFNGTDLVSYRINDGLATAVGTIQFALRPVNDVPVAVADTISTNSATALDISGSLLTQNDVDPDQDRLAVQVMSQPIHGSIGLINGRLHYIPDPEYAGVDTFTYQVNDGKVNSNTVTVTVAVAGFSTGGGDAPSEPGDGTDVPVDSGKDVLEDETKGNSENNKGKDQSQDTGASENNDLVGPSHSNKNESPSVNSVLDTRTSEDNSNQFNVGNENGLDSRLNLFTATSLIAGDSSRSAPSLSSKIISSTIASSKLPVNQLARLSTTVLAASFYEKLDTLTTELKSDTYIKTGSVATVAGISSVLTVGYVLWLVRSGFLVASFVSTMPAWQMVDPLAVVEYSTRNDDDEDDDSLEDMVHVNEDSDYGERDAEPGDDSEQ
jgi:hypothetical protein